MAYHHMRGGEGGGSVCSWARQNSAAELYLGEPQRIWEGLRLGPEPELLALQQVPLLQQHVPASAASSFPSAFCLRVKTGAAPATRLQGGECARQATISRTDGLIEKPHQSLWRSSQDLFLRSRAFQDLPAHFVCELLVLSACHSIVRL